MGDISFEITKFVDLNKTVELDITKDVDVNVNIDGQLATSEADAEVFGSPALAEVDAYTFVTAPDQDGGGTAFAYAESTAALEISEIIKFSFETGDFTNWETLGSAIVLQEDILFGEIIEPTDGTYFAKLTSFGATDSQIESFLGVAPGSIDAITAGNATDGAAIKLDDILLNGGQTITFDWQFFSNEFPGFNDISFFTTLNGAVQKLADVIDVGGIGLTGWQTASIIVPTTGTYDFGFGVTNERDTLFDSVLYVDNVIIS